MAKDGWPFIGIGLIVTIAAVLFGSLLWSAWYVLAVVSGVMTLFFAYFFRDPERRSPDGAGMIVAPADGRIVSVGTNPDGRTQIDTFLSVFDVHVNRAPAAGRVVACDYRPGQFFAAMKDEAGRHNERQNIVLDTDAGELRFAQIAGILARRIVCRVRVGDELQTGQRIGMIRFGSRMEVVLPPGFESTVAVGERVRAGETVIGRRATSDQSDMLHATTARLASS